MKKAVLILDKIPNNCRECCMLSEGLRNWICRASREDGVDISFMIVDTESNVRPDGCPLKITRVVENNINPLFIDEFIQPSTT